MTVGPTAWAVDEHQPEQKDAAAKPAAPPAATAPTAAVPAVKPTAHDHSTHKH